MEVITYPARNSTTGIRYTSTTIRSIFLVLLSTTTFCPGWAPMGLLARAYTDAPETPQPAHSSQSCPQADLRGTEISA